MSAKKGKYVYKSKKFWLVLLCVFILFAAAFILVYANRYYVRGQVMSAQAKLAPASDESFVTYNSDLTFNQIKLLDIAKIEYDQKPVSFDDNVLKYSQGVKEPWCADFASWLYKETGQPLVNPNSGSWRIPGVYTLQEYFISQNRYVNNLNYQPNVGDIAFWGSNGINHVNVVVSVDGENIELLGGNENGRMRIVKVNNYANNKDLVGFAQFTK